MVGLAELGRLSQPQPFYDSLSSLDPPTQNSRTRLQRLPPTTLRGASTSDNLGVTASYSAGKPQYQLSAINRTQLINTQKHCSGEKVTTILKTRIGWPWAEAGKASSHGTHHVQRQRVKPHDLCSKTFCRRHFGDVVR